MKKSIEILGLPIISISEGEEIGSVKSLVINPEKGSIDFLTIEHEDFQVSVKAIPFKKVIGIGEYAVTIESRNSVIDLNEIPIANQLVNKKIKITDSKVMTRKGQLLGAVTEFFADEDNGNVIGMQVKLKEKEIILSTENVLTYGKDILIVKEEASANFLERPEQLIMQDNDETLEQQKLREKQIELLEGKTVLKDIYRQNGELLIANGTVLTKEEIARAQEEGPSVLVGLSMNVEA
ncbi:PRC-barrel domain-containing protein [Peribacillus sp. SCS-155]|uniref:PRC-barrel domain-containing protein n=1 Tax=Peribacillus sedimenti TaxID=3115297 RepID=UPI003905BCF5